MSVIYNRDLDSPLQRLYNRFKEMVDYSMIEYRYEPTIGQEIYSTKYPDLIPAMLHEAAFWIQDIRPTCDESFSLDCRMVDSVFEMRVSEIS